MGMGRVFHLREGITMEVRAEFINVFQSPRAARSIVLQRFATPARNAAGVPASGFGLHECNFGWRQRSGQLLARFQW